MQSPEKERTKETSLAASQEGLFELGNAGQLTCPSKELLGDAIIVQFNVLIFNN